MVTRLHRSSAAFLAGVSASFAFLSLPASAQYPAIIVQTVPPANMRIERVGYADLNLTTQAGQDALTLRISHAVERVCLYDPHRSYRGTEPKYDQCTAGSWARARPQLIGAIFRANRYAATYRY
jgi:UrcA family protein